MTMAISNVDTKTPKAQDLVNRIGEALAGTGVISIRTDYKTTADGANRRYLVLNLAEDQERYALVSPWTGLRAQGIRRLVKYTGLAEEAADQVLDMAHALSELNDIGAWRIGTRDVVPPAVVVDGERMGQQSYGLHPGLAASFDLLSSLLEYTVAYVDIEVRRAKRSGSGKLLYPRQSWHTYYDPDGEQIAALSGQHAGREVTEWLSSCDESRRDAAGRYIRGWAKQLKIETSAMAAAFLEVLKLEQFVGVTRIDLRPPR